ncbi:MAG: choice-of-anchor Q domain-containing protein [Tepidisphaeraceae bacterium]|jgi:predicted outer membrane repeat protein
MWAGLIAIIDQGRALDGLPSLDGATQTLPMLYGLENDSLTSNAFNDIITGNNGYAAGTGYDLVTGLGTPDVANLVPDMVTPNIIYVDHTATGSNSGLSWTNAYTTLTAALSVADSDATSEFPYTIEVAEGTYTPGASTSSTFQLADNVAILGGFPSGGATASDPTTYVTILSGSGTACHVVTASGTNSTASLDGLKIKSGAANGSGSAADGGGLYDSGGSPTVANCIFTNNAAYYGGDIYVGGASSPTLAGCTFTNSPPPSVALYGGGLCDASSDPVTLTNCIFSSLNAEGGGVYNDSSALLSLSGCTFSTNHYSSGGGGAIYSISAISLSNCTFSGNYCSSDGGAIYSAAALALESCTFTGNSASVGGAIYSSGASLSLSIIDSFFYGNSASSDGGAIASLGGSSLGSATFAMVTNCVFVGNKETGGTGYGGAIYDYSYSQPTISDSTFASNSVFTSGRGGAIYGASHSSGTVVNDIFWNDSNGEIAGDGTSGSTVTYSDVDGGYSGTGNINNNPTFVRNPNLSATDYGDLQLQEDSPCIDAGPSAIVPTGLARDLAGNARETGAAMDMGAYEFPIMYVDAAATGADTGGDWADAYTTLQQALAAAEPDAGQTIEVAGGTYEAASESPYMFQLVDGVSIFGGYAGNLGPEEGISPDTLSPSEFPTILSGDGEVHHVVSGTDLGSATVLNGLTIEGGYSSPMSGLYGGGMVLYDSSPVVNDCVFTDDFAEFGGGVGALDGSSPTFTGCTISGDGAENGGGVESVNSSSPSFLQCTISGDYAGTGSGGGILAKGYLTLSVTGCTFDGDSSYDSGGAISVGPGSAEIANSVFIGDSTEDKDAGGSLDHPFSSTPFYNYGGGSAVYIFGDSSYPTELDVVNCTFTENTFTEQPHGFGPYYTSTVAACGAKVTVDNSIFWEDLTDSSHDEVSSYNYGPITINNSDLAQPASNFSGTANISCDPRFFRDPDVGDDNFGDLRLNPVSSPCIAAGSTADVPSGITTDVLGAPRTSNSTVDMGAYQTQFIYVDSAGSGTGTSWATAFTTLQAGLSAAQGVETAYPGESAVVCVGAGTYPATLTDNPAQSFELTSGVSILGGFEGTGDDANTRDAQTYDSILTGNGSSYHVVTAIEDDGSFMDGVTIQDGNADSDTDGVIAYAGGGMYIAESSPTISDCKFLNNVANGGSSSSGLGGAVLNYASSSPIFFNCLFVGNTAESSIEIPLDPEDPGGPFYPNSYGGAMLNWASSPTLVNCTFSANTAADGGAIYDTDSGAPSLFNCILWNDTGGEIAGDGPNAVKYSDIDQAGYAGSNGNYDSNPLFVNPSTPNFELESCSPVKNKGNSSYAALYAPGINIDLAGDSRTPGGEINMGAY